MTLTIVVTVVVILVAALVLLGIYSGGMNNAFGVINNWISQAESTDIPGVELAETCPTDAPCKPNTDCLISKQKGNAKDCLVPKVCCAK